MTAHQATAEIFFTAFHALPKPEKNLFLNKLIKDSSVWEDMVDMAIAKKRMKEKSVPLSEFLKKA